jgi:hypothetical protein
VCNIKQHKALVAASDETGLEVNAAVSHNTKSDNSYFEMVEESKCLRIILIDQIFI